MTQLSPEMYEFLLVLRRALLVIIDYIEKRCGIKKDMV
jgi:hypothetical protein